MPVDSDDRVSQRIVIVISETAIEMDTNALERRRLALEKMDNAEFSWYHIVFIHTDWDRAIVVAGVGLFIQTCLKFLTYF